MERHGLQRRYRLGSCITADPLPKRVVYKRRTDTEHVSETLARTVAEATTGAANERTAGIQAGGLLGKIGRATRKLYRFKDAGAKAGSVA